jgi:hypothetical protein
VSDDRDLIDSSAVQRQVHVAVRHAWGVFAAVRARGRFLHCEKSRAPHEVIRGRDCGPPLLSATGC